MTLTLATAFKLTIGEEKQYHIHAKKRAGSIQNKVQYLIKQEPVSFTPGSNLTFLAPQDNFMGAKLFRLTPILRKSVPQK